MILNLYKNGKLELTLNGELKDNEVIFENIIYDIKNNILIKEDDTFKYIINFNKEKATIELKEYNQILPLLVKNVEILIDKNKHKITYNIESEEDVLNELEIIF